MADKKYAGTMLPVRPHPQPGELFSSWVARVAAGCGIDVNGLLESLYLKFQPKGRERIYSGRIDRDPSKIKPFRQNRWVFPYCPFNVEKRPAPELMAAATGLDEERFSPMLLSSKDGLRCPKEGFTPSGVVTSKMDRTALLDPSIWLPESYCPDCLAEGFYLRRIWRVGFLGYCFAHERQLIDYCPKCRSKLDFYIQLASGRRLKREDGYLLCQQCRFDLRQSPRSELDSRDDAKFREFVRLMFAAVTNSPEGISNHVAQVICLGMSGLLGAITASKISEGLRQTAKPADVLREKAAGASSPYTRQPCFVRFASFRMAYEIVASQRQGQKPSAPQLKEVWNSLVPTHRTTLDRLARNDFEQPYFAQFRSD